MSERAHASGGAARADELLRSTPRAYEAIAHELLVLILGGHFAPGDRLPSERQLAARFGVSRPTVREALGALEARGLVATRQGSGTFVADREALQGEPEVPSDESPAELMETRLVLEVAVARLAAKRAPLSHGALDELRASVEALERTATPEAFPDELDRDFHATVARLTGNDHLCSLLEPLWGALGQELFTTLGRRSWTAESTARTAVEHRAIYEALRAGDPELAGFAMERHLRAL
ncbi:MAG TPA: FadR/GntR family transcriptional regulator, partial [Planctomycetota bacterium]|nr:FadR/GntR family transcriptional regulator [Planctomycetota bacterium]